MRLALNLAAAAAASLSAPGSPSFSPCCSQCHALEIDEPLAARRAQAAGQPPNPKSRCPPPLSPSDLRSDWIAARRPRGPWFVAPGEAADRGRGVSGGLVV